MDELNEEDFCINGDWDSISRKCRCHKNFSGTYCETRSKNLLVESSIDPLDKLFDRFDRCSSLKPCHSENSVFNFFEIDQSI